MIEARALSHIGMAVRSIDAQREFYERILGARFESIEEVPAQKVRVALFAVGPAGREVRLELIEATSADSTVARFIERHGEGLHHVSYEVDNLDARLSALKAAGVRLIDEQPRQGAHGRRVAFVHPASSFGVLIELSERVEQEAGHD